MAKLIKPDVNKFIKDKPYIEVVLDVNEFKLVHFYLKKGQKVNLHSSKSHVVITVLVGSGNFFIGDENNFKKLKQGESIYYQPLEPHGFEAEVDMVVEAFISPNPNPKLKI